MGTDWADILHAAESAREFNIAIQADCMEVMRVCPDGFFDLAVVDPPYFSGPERRGYYGCRTSKIGVHRDYPISPKWEVPGAAYFEALQRVCKRYIIWGCNYFHYHFAPGRIVWDKCNGSSSFSDCEIAATNLFDSVRLFRYMWNGMMQGKSVEEGHIAQGNKAKNEPRFHPTQKPMALYRWIYQRYTSPGDRVLDTHLGSGSSRRAALDFSLNLLGCEIEEQYFELEERAWEAYTAQERLF